MQILVIDDEPAVRKSFELVLEDEDCRVVTAESGQKGIEAFKSSKYDMVFLDLKMPGMSGIEVLRAIRSTDENTPIYVVTAFHEEFFQDLRSIAEEGKAFDVVEKPITGDQILTIIQSIQ